MAPDLRFKEHLAEITDALVVTYTQQNGLHHLDRRPLPSRDVVADILADLFDVLFPGYGRRQSLHSRNIAYYVGDLLDGLLDKLSQQIRRALRHDHAPNAQPIDFEAVAQLKAVELLRRLPALRAVLEQDVDAAYEGDPSARSRHEIVFSYPGLEAVAVYRVAHELLLLDVPLIPRMMTEAAHSKTGIDIHPGAKIGPSFFIDHGTGVVIGETCDIGSHVKLYQGVTLGALSFPRDGAGNIIRGQKRHPTLEDDVVVYANATILGGKTVVGHHAAIGSSVWLTQSVEPYSLVSLEKPLLRIRGKAMPNWATNYQI
ncbi:MAG: serine acetyltransferase [Gemmataceae bacterium]|nr:serine acetyltransferase [Gemmataceae bacterium]